MRCSHKARGYLVEMSSRRPVASRGPQSWAGAITLCTAYRTTTQRIRATVLFLFVIAPRRFHVFSDNGLFASCLGVILSAEGQVFAALPLYTAGARFSPCCISRPVSSSHVQSTVYEKTLAKTAALTTLLMISGQELEY